MTIKDIAKEANVSASTVSKIINGKDEEISDDTKKRVNEIIKKYNYKPFYNYTKNEQSTNNMVAIVIPFSNNYAKILINIEKFFFENDYNMAMYTYSNKNELLAKMRVISGRKLKGIALFCDESIDISGVIFEKFKLPIIHIDEYCYNENIKYFHMNLENLFCKLILELKNKRHTRIGYVYQKENKIRKNLFMKSAILNDIYEKQCYFFDIENIDEFIANGVTALITEDDICTRECYKFIYQSNLNIPRDISIISMSSFGNDNFIPSLSYIDFYCNDNLEAFVNLLVNKIEGYKIDNIEYALDPKLYLNDSVGMSGDFLKDGHILVIGSINMDIIKSVEKVAERSDEVFVKHIDLLVGGKGGNQAVGVAKLGGSVSLLGSIGDDTDGREIYMELNKYNIGLEHIKFHRELSTGKAYISISPKGDSRMEIFMGANYGVSVEYINENIADFENIEFCLVQSEIPIETVNYVLALANEKNIKAILLPTMIESIEQLDISGLFLLVSNKEDLAKLLNNSDALEEQCKLLFKIGVKNIIVLDNNKCIYYNGSEFVYFETIHVDVVDATGVLDCFMSTLTVYLSKGRDFKESIKVALHSSAYSKTVIGVQNAMPTSEQLEKFLVMKNLLN